MPETSRFKAIFAALAHIGVDAEPVVYEDDVLNGRGAHSSPRSMAFSSGSTPFTRGANRANLDAPAARGGRGARRLGERPIPT